MCGGLNDWGGYACVQAESADMGDTQLSFGISRQGNPNDPDADWRSKRLTDANLPHTIQMGKEYGFKRETNVVVDEEILWQNELNRLLNKAVLKGTYQVAERNMDLVQEHATPLVSQKLKEVINRLVGGKSVNPSQIDQTAWIVTDGASFTGYHRSYGTQVGYHRDGRNARLLASAFFSGGNYSGGDFVLPQTGYALCGAPGYSVHACLDILVHGISKIRTNPIGPQPPPVRISLAMYPQANVFAGAARYSAALKRLDRFSDPDLWLPFYPRGFSLDDVQDNLKTEEKDLYRKYRNEVLDYKYPEGRSNQGCSNQGSSKKRRKG